MIFGETSMFAVEALFIEVYKTRIYGQLRFYQQNRQIGNFDDTSDLAMSARWARTFLEASSRRVRPDLDHVATADVFEILYERYIVPMRSGKIGTVRNSLPKMKSAKFEVWDREPYLLDDVGESALRDKYAMLVVGRGNGSDRLIVKNFEDESLNETSVENGMVNNIIASYCDWVERLSRTPVQL
jgi:hypothetical protein